MASSAVLESAERLIAEADAKFSDKLALCKAGTPGSMAVPTDRSFNLRHHVAHNQTLTTDEHFLAMLGDVEQMLLPEFTMRGDPDKKLSAFLAGLLKTMLRETVAIPTYAARKVQLEMLWQWYSDRRRDVLDYQLSLQPTVRSSTAAATAAVDDGARADAGPSAREAAAAKAAARAQAMARHRQGETAQEPLTECPRLQFAAKDAQARDQAMLQKKLGLYRRRNLSKSAALREELARAKGSDSASVNGSTADPAGVRVVYKSRTTAQNKAQAQARDPTAVTVTGGGLPDAGPSGPSPFEHVRGGTAPVARPFGAPLLPSAERPLPEVLAEARQRVVEHMTSQAEEEADAREMRDARCGAAFQQARLEEETARRVESAAHASQAGRTCHPLLRRVPRAASTEPATVQSQLPSTRLGQEAVVAMLGRTPYTGPDTSLSPYDHYQPTPLDEARLREMLATVPGPDDAAAEERQRRGLSAPQPRRMASTAHTAGVLDVAVGADTAHGSEGARTDVPLADLLGPVLAPEADTPSLQRVQQLRQVERVRECFARMQSTKKGAFHVPRAVLERALLTPDDRPYHECLQLLPRPGQSFAPNPAGDGTGKKGKKGKGGKPKKGA